MLHFIAIWHKVQHTIIRKLDYIAAGGIINMVTIFTQEENQVQNITNQRLFNKRKC